MTSRERVLTVVRDWAQDLDTVPGLDLVDYLEVMIDGAVRAAIAEEREACATLAARYRADTDWVWGREAARDVATMIRARSVP